MVAARRQCQIPDKSAQVRAMAAGRRRCAGGVEDVDVGEVGAAHVVDVDQLA